MAAAHQPGTGGDLEPGARPGPSYDPGMSSPVLVAVDDDPARLGDVEPGRCSGTRALLPCGPSTTAWPRWTSSPGTASRWRWCWPARSCPAPRDGAAGGEGPAPSPPPGPQWVLLIAWTTSDAAHRRSDLPGVVARPGWTTTSSGRRRRWMLPVTWAESRRAVPNTVSVVGHSWSGRGWAAAPVRAGWHRRWGGTVRRALQSAVPAMPDGRVLEHRARTSPRHPARPWPPTGPVRPRVVGAGPAGCPRRSTRLGGAAHARRRRVSRRAATGSSSLIRNYLGFARGVTGAELAARHRAGLGVRHHVSPSCSASPASPRTRTASSCPLARRRRRGGPAVVLLAMGAHYRRLGLPPLEAARRRGGVLRAAASEAPALVGDDVSLRRRRRELGRTGGAAPGPRHARRVTLVVRADDAHGMSDYLVRGRATPNVAVRRGWLGWRRDGWLDRTSCCVGGGDGEEETVARGLFLMDRRAAAHRVAPCRDSSRDAAGFVLTGAGSRSAAARQVMGRPPAARPASPAGPACRRRAARVVKRLGGR